MREGNSIESCIELCDNNPDCTSADFNENGDCYLTKEKWVDNKPPVWNNPPNTAIVKLDKDYGTYTNFCFECTNGKSTITFDDLSVSQKPECQDTMRENKALQKNVTVGYTQSRTEIAPGWRHFFTSMSTCPVTKCQVLEEGCGDPLKNKHLSIQTGEPWAVYANSTDVYGFNTRYCV